MGCQFNPAYPTSRAEMGPAALPLEYRTLDLTPDLLLPVACLASLEVNVVDLDASVISAVAGIAALPISVIAIVVASRGAGAARRAADLAELRLRWDSARGLRDTPTAEERIEALNLLSSTKQMWEQGDRRLRRVIVEDYGRVWRKLYRQLEESGGLSGDGSNGLREFYRNELSEA